MPEKGRRFPKVEICLNGRVFPIRDERLHITEGFSISDYDVTSFRTKKDATGKREDTKKTDLSYVQIVKAINKIKSKFGLTDSYIATIQLYSLNINQKLPSEFWRNTPEEKQNEIFRFLDYLNCLMFGMEASGLNAAIIISLMTLDLIKDRHLDYRGAFRANQDGGIYPYANTGKNRGTYSNRERILLHRKENREPKSTQEFRENPNLSPVAVKEAMLIRKWLRVNQVFTGEKRFETQLEEIQKSVEDILCCYLCHWEQRNWFLKKFEEQKKQFGDGLP